MSPFALLRVMQNVDTKLTCSQLELLLLVYSYPGLSQTELRQHTTMDAGYISSVVRDLTKNRGVVHTNRRYIKRIQSNTDKRYTHLHLTSAGRELINRILT